jgi:diguanylate cyclase (GGDEF)-like protein
MSRFENKGFGTFVRAAHLLNSSLDLDAVLRGLLDGMEELLRPSSWSLLLREDDSDTLQFRLVRNARDLALIGRRLAPGEGIAGSVMKSGETLLIPDVRQDPRFSNRMDQEMGFATRSIIAVPLRVESRAIGVIEIVNTLDENALDERNFDPDDVRILESFADFAAIAIRNAQVHQELLELTRNDPLSGLRNSQHFLSCVEQAVTHGERFAVLFSDMDHFKELVDRHGHMNGSAALAEVGRVYVTALRRNEVGCRFGGDEFAFLIPGADGARAAERCEQLTARLNERTFLDRQGICTRLGASFGWAAFPEDAATAELLLQIADSRMYETKRAQRKARGSTA